MKNPLSRRRFLRTMLTTAGCALPGVTVARAATLRLAKVIVHYQDQPKGHDMCGMCRFFLPAVGHSNGMMMQGLKPTGTMAMGHCVKVAGRISPMGYCVLFTPRLDK